VSVIDTKTDTVSTTIPAGDGPNGVAITPKIVAAPKSPNGPTSS
jgi:DNA-binding beta-propeller fold protein YncE